MTPYFIDQQDALLCIRMDSDGWIYLARPYQRLCWIPVEYRGAKLASNGKRVALGTTDGRVVVLDFSCLAL